MRVLFLLVSLLLLGQLSVSTINATFSPMTEAEAAADWQIENRKPFADNPKCPLGKWCSSTGTHDCPAGTYGDQHGLQDDSCSGSCGLMWTSDPGSLSCYNLSVAGDVIITIIVLLITGVVMAITIFISSKASQSKWLGKRQDEPAAAVSIETEMRAIIQKQIRAGVDALATRVVRQSFPSILSLSSSLIQFNYATPDQINIGIKAARTELAEHIQEVLLQHPRLRFDDDTYPAKRPLWAEVDPTSEDGATEIHAASSTIAPAIRNAVETDLLEWFRRQHRGEEPAYEESQQGLLSDGASSEPSRWPIVDSELKIALRTAMAEPSCFKCLSGNRSAYAEPSMRPMVMEALLTFFRMAFDILVLVACFVGILGKVLITVDIPLSRSSFNSLKANFNYPISCPLLDPYTLSINWAKFQRPTVPLFWFYEGSECGFTVNRNALPISNLELFQPILDECVGDFGRTYRSLLIFTCTCFWLVTLPSFFSFCGAFCQLIPEVRGISLGARVSKAGNKFKQIISSRVLRNGLPTWILEVSGALLLSTIRFLGTMSLVAAVSMYSTACIARLKRAPAFGEPWYSSEMNIRVEYSVVMQGAFIIAIVAASLALIPAAVAVQQAFQKFSQTVVGENEQQGQQQRSPRSTIRNHSVEMHVMIHPDVAATADGSGGSGDAASSHSSSSAQQKIHSVDGIDEKEQTVALHSQAGVSINAPALTVEDTDVEANLPPLRAPDEGKASSQSHDETVSSNAFPSPGAPAATVVQTESGGCPSVRRTYA